MSSPPPDPAPSNQAKGRDADQPVALWAHHSDTLDTLDRLWDLTPKDRLPARLLLGDAHLTVLLPLRPGAEAPAWLAPAQKDGWVLLFGARWQPLRSLLDEHPVLYVSSANRTGHQPAATTEEALAMFPTTVPVLRAPASTDTTEAVTTTARQATTTVRLHPDSRIELHRSGAQDRNYNGADAYLGHLRARNRDTAG
ncbi:hypothetical protein [Streptomyces sp. NPDC060322]|uniref:hypothetical protein n=1 Tax=Streptomyces sp. NPDC060322 TaxID=3347097 RepID=UPI0036487350